MSATVRQIGVSSDPGMPYFLRVDWAADLGAGFTVVLSDCSSAWMGEVSEEELTREARSAGVERETYVEDLHQALTGGGGRRGAGGDGGREASGTEAYSFRLSADRRRLSYEKNLGGVQTSMGSVELLPALDHMETTRDLIGHSVKRCSQLQLENKQLLEQRHTLGNNHQHLLSQLEQCVEDKVGMETDLYSRFALVLHEKKGRIRGLQDSLRRLQQSSLAREDEGEEMERGETVTDQSECGDNVPKMGESSQSFRWSQAPTVLIHRDVSQENSMEDSVSDDSGVLPSSKPRLLSPRLLSPRSPESNKASLDRK